MGYVLKPKTGLSRWKGLRQRLGVSLLMVFSVTLAHAQNKSQQDIHPLADFVADAFMQKARDTNTPWREDEALRYADGLFAILEGYSEQLGEENTRVLREFLPDYAQEMAGTIITDQVPPPLFIDAFLSDFADRVSALAQRGGPIFPDENTRLVIKAQLSQYMDEICQDLQPAGDVTAEDIEAIKDRLLQNLYKRADHPLRSEFKRPASPAVQQLVDELRTKVAAIDFADESYYTLSRRHDPTYRKMIQRSLVSSKVLQMLVLEWQIEPMLMTSNETQQIYDQAIAQLEAMYDDPQTN